MTIFVDASAFIAIIAREAEGVAFVDVIAAEGPPYSSAVSIWETVAGLHRSHGFPVAQARDHVKGLMAIMGFQYVPIGEAETTLALDAYERYGKGRHPAALNMGDCLAYACAKANGAKLLFKGDDFSKTDIARAAWG